MTLRIWLAYHRLAWFLHHGSFPEETIDHINGNPKDNRLCNLRMVSISINTRRATFRECPRCGKNIHDDLPMSASDYQKQNA